jgi:hypothetical protein
MTDGGRRRWRGLLVVAAATASVTGCATSSGEVQVAAATRSAAAPTWFLDSGGVVPALPTVPTTVGLSPVIPRPGEFSVPRPAPYGVPAETEPPPAVCGGYASPVRINPGAVPGPGTATISWQADGRPEVVGYRVQAVSQDIVSGTQPVPRQRSVGQPAGCEAVTVTMTGLTRGGVYVFWLEEAVVDPQTSVTRLVQVGTSSPVVIP